MKSVENIDFVIQKCTVKLFLLEINVEYNNSYASYIQSYMLLYDYIEIISSNQV